MANAKGSQRGARRVVTLAMVAAALAGIAFNFSLTRTTRFGRNVDFDTFYAAGKLAGTGRLYDWDAIQALERQNRASNPLPFGRIPAVAFAFKPLSALPYKWAEALWLGIGIAALGGFVALWPLAGRLRAAAAVCWSFPAAMVLAFGQDTTLFLFFVALGVWLLIREKEVAAGVVLSLCVIKPHLALLVPIWLIATRKWKTIGGGLGGGIAILAVSFAVEGIDWPKRFLAAAPGLADAPLKMPNMRGLLALVGSGMRLEVALALLLAGAVWYLSRHVDLTTAAALALAGGLAVSHHAYTYDAVLLLPLLLVTWERDGRAWLRLWTLLLFTPIPYLLLLAEKAWPAQLALMGYILVLLGAEVYRVGRGSQAGEPTEAPPKRSPVGPV
ncbi:MAG TPA: glycosyltransferase family 87 protein [Bryobacteraceae bacterium]|jgi:hypothetical protein